MKLNKFLSFFFGGAMMLAGFGCTDEVKYNPAPEATGDQVYFSADEKAVIDIPNEAESVTVNINRANTKGALEVGLTAKAVNAAGEDVLNVIFDVPTMVSFVDGEGVAPINIGVKFTDLTPEEEYVVTITIDEASASLYGLHEREFILSYAPWTEWDYYSKTEMGTYTYVPGTIWSNYGFKAYEDTIFTRKSLVNENLVQYKINSPFVKEDGSPEWEQIVYVNKAYKVEIDGVKYPLCYTNVYETPVKNGEDGEFLFSDWFTWVKDYINEGIPTIDETLTILARNNENPSYFDEERGLFVLNMLGYTASIEPGSYYPGLCGEEYLQLPGFKDYYVEVNHLGNFVTPLGQESVAIQVYHSEDVASFSYAIHDGHLSKTEIAAACKALEEDAEADIITTNPTRIEFVPETEESADYTIVYVAYDEKGAVVVTDGYQFKFETVKQTYMWKKLGYCEYTDGIFSAILKAQGSTIKPQTWDVIIEQHKEDAGMFRMVNPYYDMPYNSSNDHLYCPYGNFYVTLNVNDPEKVVLEEGRIGMSMPKFVFQDKVGLENIAARTTPDKFGTYADGVITFPAGGLQWSSTSLTNEDGSLIWNTANYNFQSLLPTMGTGCFELKLGMVVDNIDPTRLTRRSRVVENAGKKFTPEVFRGSLR